MIESRPVLSGLILPSPKIGPERFPHYPSISIRRVSLLRLVLSITLMDFGFNVCYKAVDGAFVKT